MGPPERVPESLQSVVLAGGDSTRFGAEDKALANINSEPILARIVTVLRQTTHRVPVLVVRTREQQMTYANTIGENNAQFVFDMPEYEGPLAGILGAAASLDSQWLFCCGCDMPLLASTAVRWLVDQLPHEETNRPPEQTNYPHEQTSRREQIDAVAFEHPNGVVEPLHTVYRRESVVELQDELPRTAGPRRLLSELDRVYTVSKTDVPDHIPLEMSTSNVNTHQELETIRNRTSWL